MQKQGRLPAFWKIRAAESGISADAARALRRLHRRTLAALIAGMALMGALVLLVSIALLYHAAYAQELSRLSGSTAALAALLEAVAQFDRQFSAQDNPGGSFGATMSQVEAALLDLPLLSPTEQIELGWREGAQIHVLRLKPGKRELERLVLADSGEAAGQPVAEALSGARGSRELTDNRGVRLLCGFAPVPTLGAGIAQHIELAVVRAPFMQAAWVCALVAFLAGVGGALGAANLLRPLARKGLEAHAALRVSESRLALAAQGTDQGIWDLDLISGEAWLSPRGQELLGYEPGELKPTRKGWEERVHPEDRARALEEIRLHLEERSHYRTEYRLRMKDDSYRWFRAAGQAEWDSAGRPLRMAGSIEDITERKEAQLRLAESEAQLRLMLEVLPVGVWIIGPTGQIIHGNEAGRRIWGGARFVGIEGYGEYKGWWHDSGQPIAPEEWAAARAIRKGETSLNEVIDIESFDGSRKTMLHSAVPLRDAQGAICGAIVVNQDITENMRQQRELEASRAYLKAIFDNEPECIKLLDREGRLLDMNPAGLAMLEAESLEQFRGQPVEGLVCAEDRPAFRELTAAALRGETGRLRFAVTGLKGTRRLLESVAVPLWNAGGSSVEAVLAVTRDVTAIAQTEQALQESLARLNEAQRIAHIGSWELDLESNRLSWSAEIFRLFEIDPEKFGASYEAFLEAVHPEDRAMVNEAYRRSLESRAPYGIVHRLLMPDGRIKYVREECETHYDGAGRALRSIGTVQDITSEVLAAQKLEAQLAEKELLLKEVHHRVKNNLQIISSLFYLQASTAKDAGLRDLLRDGQTRIEAMVHLHETLYQREDFASIDFREYAGMLCRHLQHSFGADTQPISIEIQSDGTALDLSRAVSCGLIINEAVSNSLKHAFPDGRPGRIVVGYSKRPDGWLELCVSDDGVGLPENGGIRDGALGLRLMERLAGQLGGRLERGAGPGVAYRVSFPEAGV